MVDVKESVAEVKAEADRVAAAETALKDLEKITLAPAAAATAEATYTADEAAEAAKAAAEAAAPAAASAASAKAEAAAAEQRAEEAKAIAAAKREEVRMRPSAQRVSRSALHAVHARTHTFHVGSAEAVALLSFIARAQWRHVVIKHGVWVAAGAWGGGACGACRGGAAHCGARGSDGVGDGGQGRGRAHGEARGHVS